VATQIFLEFSPLKKLGKMIPMLTWAYFSKGLVQPPTVGDVFEAQIFNHLDFQFSLDLQGPDFSWIDQIVGEDGLEAGG